MNLYPEPPGYYDHADAAEEAAEAIADDACADLITTQRRRLTLAESLWQEGKRASAQDVAEDVYLTMAEAVKTLPEHFQWQAWELINDSDEMVKWGVQ